MIRELTYIRTENTYPYKNLAIEELLLLNCKEGECILYLWQNRNTIVIGRNQNGWKECLVSKLEAEGGFLVRRLSGGGAVYHDLGNLNFTFLVRKEDYNLEKQIQVILLAVQKLGIKAEKSGRNDILIEGKKFSGNAFYEQAGHCYHHGTIMMNVNLEELSKYLTVSKEKLQSKGVASVKSRVTNLSEYADGLTVDKLCTVLREAFEEVYGLQSKEITEDGLDQKEIKARTENFESWDWIFGKKMDFQYELSKKFVWGEVTLQFKVQSGVIQEMIAYSDCMKTNLMAQLKKYLVGLKYNKNVVCKELNLFWSADHQEEEMMKDIISWLETVEF